MFAKWRHNMQPSAHRVGQRFEFWTKSAHRLPNFFSLHLFELWVGAGQTIMQLLGRPQNNSSFSGPITRTRLGGGLKSSAKPAAGMRSTQRTSGQLQQQHHCRLLGFSLVFSWHWLTDWLMAWFCYCRCCCHGSEVLKFFLAKQPEKPKFSGFSFVVLF